MRPTRLILPLLLSSLLASTAWAKQPEGGSDESSEEGAAEGATEGEDSPDEGSTAAEAPAEPPAESEADPTDLEALRAEYFKLRDRLFQSRARAGTVASALYSTRMRVHLDYGSARYYTVTRATVRLDGANVFDDTQGAISEDKAPRFEGFVAPGRHQLSIRIEATGKDDERFSTVQEHSFVVQAIKGKELEIKARASDDGSMPFSWAKKKRGSYKLHLDVSVRSKKPSKGDSGHIKRTGGLGKNGQSIAKRS